MAYSTLKKFLNLDKNTYFCGYFVTNPILLFIIVILLPIYFVPQLITKYLFYCTVCRPVLCTWCIGPERWLCHSPLPCGGIFFFLALPISLNPLAPLGLGPTGPFLKVAFTVCHYILQLLLCFRTRIQWAKDHKVIGNNKKYRISKKGALRIADVTYVDSGVYTCIGKCKTADVSNVRLHCEY